MRPHDISDELLLAYIDGALDPEERQDLAALINTRPELSPRVAALRHMQAEMRSTFKAVDRLRPPSSRMWSDISRRTRRRHTILRNGWKAVSVGLSGAFCLLLVIAFALVLGGKQNNRNTATRLIEYSTTATASPSYPSGEAPASVESTRGSTISQFFAAYNRGDRDAVLALLAEIDYSVCDVPGGTQRRIQDQAELEQWLQERFAALERFAVDEVYEDARKDATQQEMVITQTSGLSTDVSSSRRRSVKFVVTEAGEQIRRVEFPCKDAPPDVGPVMQQAGDLVADFLDAYNRADREDVMVTLAQTKIDLVRCVPDQTVQTIEDTVAWERWLRDRFAEHDHLQLLEEHYAVADPQSTGPATGRITVQRTNDQTGTTEVRISFRFTPQTDKIDKITFYCQ